MSEKKRGSGPPRLRRLVALALELSAKKRGWGRLRAGVEILQLAGDPKRGASAALLRYRPGARVPPHRHLGFELIYVLEGSQSDERGTYSEGMLVVNQQGGGHSVWSEEGCLVLIVWEKPIEFL